MEMFIVVANMEPSFYCSFQGQDEFIGQTVVKPVVRLSLETAGPRLDWYPIIRYNKYAGELLAAFELLLVSMTILLSLIVYLVYRVAPVGTCLHNCKVNMKERNVRLDSVRNLSETFRVSDIVYSFVIVTHFLLILFHVLCTLQLDQSTTLHNLYEHTVQFV